MPQIRAMQPGSLDQALALAEQHFDVGKLAAASAMCRDILRVRPNWPAALRLLGGVAFRAGDLPGATQLLQRAIDGDPMNGSHYGVLAGVYRAMGRLNDARITAEKAIALAPRDGAQHYTLSLLKTFAADDPDLAAMERLASDMTLLSIPSQTYLHFALAKAYDDIGRTGDAARHLLRGNTLKRAQIAYDEGATLEYCKRIRSVFDRRFVEVMRAAGNRSPVPVFIVGMPRSGTSLVEQILASHPQVHGAGELADLNNQVQQVRSGQVLFPESVCSLSASQISRFGKAYVLGLRRKARDAARITDKSALLFQQVGMIALALPSARVIRVRRDPLDTCFSCYFTLFEAGQPYAYDQGELGRYYRAYAELMGHWREVLPTEQYTEVQYEAIVADLEGEARRLVAFCGLDWDSRCLAFHQTQRAVMTASAGQVRRPIYQTSRGRATAYREHLGALIAALGDLTMAT